MKRTRKAVLLLLVGLLSSLALTSCGETANGHFKKGNEFTEASQFVEAAQEYEKALEIELDNVDVMTNLGAAYYRLGELDKAIDVYTRAIAIAPNDADIRSNLAAAYVQKHEPGGSSDHLEMALEQYAKAVELAPDLPEAFYGMGAVYALMGRIDDAIQAFEKFQELDTGSDSKATDNAKEILKQLRGQ